MAFETTVATLFNGLLTAGLARLGSLAFHKVARINKIEQEIKAGPAQDTPIARALHDLQIVLGTCYGPYTQELASFLAELQRSGIVNLLAEEAAFSRKKPACRELFMRLHAEHFPDREQDGARLFDVVFRCFTISLSEQMRDKSLALLIKSLDKSITRRLDIIKQTNGLSR